MTPPDRSLELDWPLSAVALLAAVVSGSLLAVPATLRPVGWTPPSTSAGSLTFQVGEVRRRPAGTLVWYPASRGDALFEGDALFVAPGAAARVALETGGQLQLDESTLVVLEPPARRGPNRQRVAVHKGSLEGTAGPIPLHLETGGAVAAMEPGTRAEVEVDPTGAQISVRQGAVSVEGPGKPQRLGAAETGTLSSGGRISRAPAHRVGLQSPAPRHRQLGHSPLRFVWRPAPPGAALQLASDRGFARPQPPVPGQGEAVQALAPGLYWWRVVGADGKPLSEARALTVLESTPPKLISPARDDRYTESTLGLRWAQVEGATGYQLEIAGDPGFTQQVLQQDTSAPDYRWSGVPEGAYWWRVRATLAAAPGPWSAPSSFQVVLKPLPAAPVLREPEIEILGADAGLP